jgi:predicted PurR-regulated permease PerM
MSEQTKTLDISWSSIFKVAIAFLAFYLLFLLRDVLVSIIFALIISVLFSPAINFLKNKGLPRGVAVVLIYILFFGILGSVIYAVADPIVEEIRHFSDFFSKYHEDLFEKIGPTFKALGIETLATFDAFSLALQDWLEKASDNIFVALGTIFGGIFTTFTILILSLFISLEEKGFERILTVFTPQKYDALVLTLWEKTQRKVGGWFGVRILASLFVGLLTFVALYVFKTDYAISLAFFAGITNFIPIIGPVIAGIVIGLIVFLDAPITALFVVLAFILIQQIESILTPILSRKFVGMSPILVLIALLVGWSLWGILGAILAIPVLGILFEFLRDFFKRKKEAEAVVL